MQASGNSTNLFNNLRQFVDTDVLVESLNQSWGECGNGESSVTQVDVERVFPLKQTRYSMELQVSVEAHGSLEQHVLLAEYVDENVGHQLNKIIASLKKKRRAQLPKHKNRTNYIFALEQYSLILRCPGLDERLQGLILFKQNDLSELAFKNIFKRKIISSKTITHQLISHRLGKRCLYRCCINEQDQPRSSYSVIAKVYKSRATTGVRTFNRMSQLLREGFDSHCRLRISMPLFWSDDHQVLWMEDIQGLSLDQLDQHQQSKALYDTGALLAKLHSSQLDLKQNHNVDDEFKILDRWVNLTASLRPDLHSDLKSALSFVAQLLKKINSLPRSTVHRDFYDRQLIYSGKSVVLIDFDTLSLSYPELDLGNFIAHLELRRLQGVNEYNLAESYLLSGYSNLRQPDLEAIEIFKKASLLRLSCLYSFRSKWKHLTLSLLDTVYV